MRVWVFLLSTALVAADLYELDARAFRKDRHVGMHPGLFCREKEKAPTENMCSLWGPSQLALKNRSNEGVGFDTGYSTIELFFTPSGTESHPFVDLRGHIFNDLRWVAANGGIGLRVPCRSAFFGINTYYDYRKWGELQSNQISLGLEVLSRYASLTLGGYYPFEVRAVSSAIQTLSDTTASQRTRRALPYADADLTFTLPLRNGNWAIDWTVGGYYLFHVGKPGVKGEIAFSLSRWFSLGATYTYDRTFYSRTSGFAALHIPLKWGIKKQASDCKRFRALNNKALSPPRHNEIIPMLRTKRVFDL